jgi:hypothetical protein
MANYKYDFILIYSRQVRRRVEIWHLAHYKKLWFFTLSSWPGGPLKFKAGLALQAFTGPRWSLRGARQLAIRPGDWSRDTIQWYLWQRGQSVHKGTSLSDDLVIGCIRAMEKAVMHPINKKARYWAITLAENFAIRCTFDNEVICQTTRPENTLLSGDDLVIRGCILLRVLAIRCETSLSTLLEVLVIRCDAIGWPRYRRYHCTWREHQCWGDDL